MVGTTYILVEEKFVPVLSTLKIPAGLREFYY